MANVSRWWVAGGTGNTNSTTNWAASSGGASGASVPVAGDDAFFDGASGTNTVTVNAAFSCHSWDMTNSGNRTVTGSSAITVGGGSTNTAASVFTLVAGITWTASGQFNWDNRSGGHTFTMAGVSCPAGGSANFFIRGSGNTALTTFADNCTTNTSLQINGTGGVTIASGKTLSCAVASANSTFTLTYSGATITTTTTTATPWDISGGTVTLTGNSTSNINCTVGSAAQFVSGASSSYPGTVTITLSSSVNNADNQSNPGRLAAASGTTTFVNLTVNGSATAGSSTSVCSVQAITVSGVLTLAGNSQKNRLAFMAVGNGLAFQTTKKTITCNGSFSLTNVDFRNITTAGTAGTWTGTSLGNMLGNSGITFTGAVTRYWVGATASTFAANANNWASTSGGTGTASMPLPQDTATFDATSVPSTMTLTNDNVYFPVFDSSLAANTLTINFINSSNSQQYQHFTGSLTLSSTTTITQTRTLATGAIFFNDAATLTVTPNGGTFSSTAGTPAWNIWSSLTVSGASTWTSIGLALSNVTATLDFSTGNLTSLYLQLGSGTPTLSFGGYYYTFNTTTAAATAFSLNAGGSISGSTSMQVVISNGSSAVTVTPTTLAAIGTLTVTGTGAVTFGAGKVNVIAMPFGGTIKAPGGGTLTILQLEAVGKSGSLITIGSSTAGAATISCASGLINLDWCSITNITAAGGATFYTGPNTTYGAGNSGWSGTPPTSGPGRQQLTMLGMGGY